MPLELIDSKVITITPNEINVAMLEKKLRLGDAHIIARVYDDKYVLDARTIFEDEFEIVKEELEKALIGG